MRKILIIGKNSYIGNSFISYMKQFKDKQIQIDKISARGDDWVSFNFCNYDVILYVAGIAHRRETRNNAEEYYKVNKELAIKIAKKARESGVDQFIFMSTAAVFGTDIHIITKETIPQPNTHYGKSKLEAEYEIMKLKSDNFKVAIIRPPMVYGSGCKGNYQRLVKLAKITPIFPDIQNKRSMIYIVELCRFIQVIIDHELWGYFHPQNSEYVCTSEMVKLIGKRLGRNIYFTKAFNPGIRLLAKRVASIDKMFGDWYYQLDDEYSKIS